MNISSLIFFIIFSLFTTSNIKGVASETNSKVKARYVFKKGKKNQEAIDKISKGYTYK